MKLINKTRLCSLAAAALIAVSCFALTGCGSSSSTAASTAASSTAASAAAAANEGTCGENLADQITTVEVEGTVTSVGATAFKDCTSLTTVNIADGVEYIEAGAFNGCTALTEANIPESVTYIKAGAFKNCDALTAVTIRSNCRLDMNVFPSTTEVGRYN